MAALLQYPPLVGGGKNATAAKQARFKFGVAGQTLCNLELLGNPAISYDAKGEGGSKLDTASALGNFMAHAGSAIGVYVREGQLRLYDVLFSWQKAATIKNRPVTELDAQLQGTQLAVIDASAWTNDDLSCPQVGDDGQICGGKLNPKGWASNATSSKGGGGVHTVYLASARRVCSRCSKLTSDNQLMRQLPPAVRHLLPMERSAASGLPKFLFNLMLALIPTGVTFGQLARAANNLIQTQHAEQRLDLYDMMLKRAQPRGQEKFLYPTLGGVMPAGAVQEDQPCSSGSSALSVGRTSYNITPSFLIDMYLSDEGVERLLKAHRALQGTYAHWVLKLDGGFKVRAALTCCEVLC